MIGDFSVSSLLEKGDVFSDVRGCTAAEIYDFVCSSAKLPEGLDAQVLKNELVQREHVLSTAVGNGIAIPHPRRPLLKNTDDARIIVCFPKVPVEMESPDGLSVYAMFILLSDSTQSHIHTLSALAKLFRDVSFRKILSSKPSKKVLVEEIRSRGF